jgi:hypothetical protein
MDDVCPQPVATPEHSSPRLHSAEDEALTEAHHGADHGRLNEFTAAADATRFPLTFQALPIILTSDQERRFELAMRITLSGIAALITESRYVN